MATSAARKEARSNLGSFDTSAYDELRTTARGAYDTSVAEYGNTYNQLVNKLNANRQANSRSFAEGRGAAEIPAVIANRQTQARQSAAGRGDSSFSRMNDFSTGLALGNQYNTLANTFYNNLEDINREREAGESAYNLGLRSAEDAYKSSLANINLGAQQAQNSYNQAVAQLAESIQSRWDSNANAAASLKAQKEANANSLKQVKLNYAMGLLGNLSEAPTSQELERAITQLTALGYSGNEIKDIINDYTGSRSIIINSNGQASVPFETFTGTIDEGIKDIFGNYIPAETVENAKIKPAVIPSLFSKIRSK